MKWSLKTIIVLAMHGSPPNDVRREELSEFFSLHSRLEMSPVSHSPALESRYQELSEKIKNWPRTPANDPYHAASYQLAHKLSAEIRLEVVVGFNEFCAPGIDEALDDAVEKGTSKVIVVTTMLTRGGEHAERDIAQSVEQARERFPDVEITYAWPFETEEIARFLAGHVKRLRK